ncbi:hypothetical protein EV191_106225 [Tamaricihabitans halophyticus]|uniref:Secreted protein n=1 Tax=Tamaricihabitans halophyticus TaxID=1262583 RepID=A0A4R2QY65_9PSEU|nr:hypothetical protein EV191_106225 [Tamaricihabitans halophyticus]
MSHLLRAAAARGLFVTWCFCAADGLDHAVTDDEFARLSTQVGGGPRAICGHQVQITSALVPPGPICRACVAGIEAVTRPEPTRDANKSWWRRTAGRRVK